MNSSDHSKFEFCTVFKRRVWTIANIPAFVVTVVMIVATIFIEANYKRMHIARDRSEVLYNANLVASRLEGLIEANLQLIRGFSGALANDPHMTVDRFNVMAASLFNPETLLRHIVVAPDMVISMVYPLKGNEKALGMDLGKHAVQKAMALKARDEREIKVAGPVHLVQGIYALIIRDPIFLKAEKGQSKFWGLISAVMPVDALYEAAGMAEASDHGLDIALVGRDGKGTSGDRFFGSASIVSNDPVSVPVDFSVGRWQLLAVPHEGWVVPQKEIWMLRGGCLLALLFMLVPTYFLGRLYVDRIAHLKSNIENQVELARMTKRLEMALETSRIGVWEYDPASRKPSWDERMNELYGFPPAHPCSNKDWQRRLHPADRERVNRQIADAINENATFKTRFRICLPDGEIRFLRGVGSLLTDEQGETRLIGVNWDITEDEVRERELSEARAESERRNRELEKANARIEASAKHDFLTGLPNRRFLNQRFRELTQEHQKLAPGIRLIKIDLDGFKEINDTLGHAAGDAMLLRTANILRKLITTDEFAARVGGDEFVILCTDEGRESRARELGDQIIAEIQKSFEYHGRSCRLGASIGIAACSQESLDPDKLLSNADLALYQAKQSGKGRLIFFSKPMFENARRQRQLADDLVRGIEQGEFVAYYQGQYCARTHKLMGAEALARWVHPERGLLDPSAFVPLAETMGLMSAIDAIVLDHAIETLDCWQEQKLQIPRVSVNVSAKRLCDKNLIANLNKMAFDPTRLTFELVESTFLDRSDDQVASNLRMIREMGIDIEIDDFGTAYASIVSLTHLLPNKLKIDRELIRPIIESADQRELVHSIIHIGRTLGIGTVAEGVETMEHAEILRIMGIDVLQGYAFCQPLDKDTFFEHHRCRGDVRAA